MSVCWKELRRGAIVTSAMLLGAMSGCTADASQDARAAVVIERVTDPLRVVSVEVGTGIGPDQRVVDATAEFQNPDTVYASVVMVGRAEGATLKARWTAESGKLLDEMVRTISPSGETVAEFHLAQPMGWTTGTYSVEIVLDGVTVGREEFRVS
ncbi:MAG TPA: hypothetical protein VFU01_14055 [Gemmatimonadaceae bacterium]|nr:hypothetical protein [Gemmatimonadaceae bacterium]